MILETKLSSRSVTIAYTERFNWSEINKKANTEMGKVIKISGL